MKTLIYVVLVVVLTGCNRAPSTEMPEADNGLIRLTGEQLDYNGIQTGKMPRGPLYHKVKATGHVDIPPNYAYKISAPIESYITRINVLPGDRVTRGQVVARIRHAAIALLQEQYLATRAELDYLQKDIRRKDDLVGGSAVSVREYERLKSEEAAKSANLKSIEAELSRIGLNPDGLKTENVTQYVDVRAPIAGVVTDLFSQTGQYIGPNDPLLGISSREHEHVELEVFQDDIGKLRKGMEVWLRLPGQNSIYNGEVFLINTQLKPETLSANVHVHPGDDFPDLPINAVVFGEIIHQVDTGYVLPKSEVMREGSSFFIFIKTDEGFEKKQVQIGYDDGEHVEIKGPEVVLDSEVVVKGNYYLNGV